MRELPSHFLAVSIENTSSMILNLCVTSSEAKFGARFGQESGTQPWIESLLSDAMAVRDSPIDACFTYCYITACSLETHEKNHF